MTILAHRFRVSNSEFRVEAEELETRNSRLETRLLAQAARELLLAESSDWAFQIYQGTTVQYSTRRFESHIQRFNMLAEMLEALQKPTREQGRNAAAKPELSADQLDLLSEIERRDNIFPEIDWRVYCS